MGLSRRTLTALEALLEISLRSGVQPVSASDLADRIGISRRALEPILQTLVKAGYLVSTRGPAGGYTLGIERTRLKALDVAMAVDRDSLQDLQTSRLSQEVIQPLAERVTEAERTVLGQLTLADLRAEAERKGFGTSPAPIDYAI